jgi:ABC-2 type transport system permease protein
MFRLLWHAMKFQMLHMRRSLDDLMALVTLPLFTLAFLSIVVEAGRPDLAPYAIIGTALMAIWSTALFVSGEMIEIERSTGTLEASVATPAPLGVVVTGRIAAVTLVSLLGLAESMLIAWVVFGIVIEIHHPAVFLITLLCMTFAVVGTAILMSSMFVMARSARLFQNSLSYPFFLLGGVMVPVSLLPSWLEAPSRLIFFSWAADLLRESTRPEIPANVPLRLGIILLLGAVALGAGLWMIDRILKRIRQLGTIGHA